MKALSIRSQHHVLDHLVHPLDQAITPVVIRLRGRHKFIKILYLKTVSIGDFEVPLPTFDLVKKGFSLAASFAKLLRKAFNVLADLSVILICLP